MSSITTAGTASVANILTVNDLTYSSDVNAPVLATVGEDKCGNFIPITAAGKNNYSKDDYVTFSVTVASGYNFFPTSATAKVSGAGTGDNGAQIFATVQTANGSNSIANSGKSPNTTNLSLTSFSSSTIEGGQTLYFYIHIGTRGNTDPYKGVDIRDVVLTGTYTAASTDPAPASITTQPSNIEANVGLETTLSVEAAGYPAPEYQWYSCDDAEKTNAKAIDGATSASYSFTPEATGNLYFYVTVSNVYEEEPVVVTSNVATVTVIAPIAEIPTFKVYGNTVQLASATDGATIYYELDNPDVKTSGSKVAYTGAFIPASSGTIYAYAEKAGYIASDVASQAVTLSTVGDVVGNLIATVQAAKSAETTVFGNITVTSPESPTWDGRGTYPNHMKVSGEVTLTASSGTMIKSIKIYGTSNDGSKAATITAGDGATVISTPAELMPRDVSVGGVQTMTEIVVTVDEPTINNSVSFTLGRESRLYIEVYGTEYVSKTVTAAGWATYCSPYALDLANATGLTDAYIVTGATGSVLSTTSVKGGTIPANTGILIEAPVGTVTIPVVASSSTDVSKNKLVGVLENTEKAAESIYVLMDETAGVGFYKNNNAFTVGANTAYLNANFAEVSGSARAAYFFGGDITGVNQVEAASEAEVKEGKFIENGKLVIVKNGVKYNAAGAKLY